MPQNAIPLEDVQSVFIEDEEDEKATGVASGGFMERLKGKSFMKGASALGAEVQKNQAEAAPGLTGLLQGFVGAVDKVTELQRDAYNFVPELMGLPEAIPKGSKEETIAIEANRTAAMLTATATMSALTKGKGTGPAMAQTAGQISRSAQMVAELAGVGGLKSQVLSFSAKVGAPAGISALFGGPESEKAAAAETGAVLGGTLGLYAGSVLAAPPQAKPFIQLMGWFGKNPNMTKAAGGFAGAAGGALAGFGGTENMQSEDHFKMGLMMTPGVFQLFQGKSADNLVKEFTPTGKTFQRAVEESASQPSAAGRATKRFRDLLKGENLGPDEAARSLAARTIPPDDVKYVDVLNRLNPVRAGEFVFVGEMMNDPDLARVLVKATGGEEGPVGRAIAHRAQDQLSVMFGYDFTEKSEKLLQGLLTDMGQYGDKFTNKALIDSGLTMFPGANQAAQASNLVQKLEVQEAMFRTISRVTALEPNKFAMLMHDLEKGSREALKKKSLASVRQGWERGAAPLREMPANLDRQIDEMFGMQVKPVIDSLKDEYLRRNIIGSAAKPLSHVASGAADQSASLTKGDWVFDGQKLLENVQKHKDALSTPSMYGPKGYSGLEDWARLVGFHQRKEAEAFVEQATKTAKHSMSFMTHRLLFSLSTGQLTGAGGTLKGMLLGMGALQGAAEATSYGVSLARLSKFATVEPELINELVKATMRGDQIKEQAVVRAILPKLTGLPDAFSDSEE